VTPECERLGLNARRVGDGHDVDMLRSIRNACKDGFAHDNEAISVQAQKAWWIVNRDRVKAWLYWREGDGIIGYGLVRQTDDGRWWNSIAVLPLFAGKGYGSAITADLVARCSPYWQIWAEVRVENIAAMRMHRRDDWELMGFVGGLAQFRSRIKVTA
jgi:ribosomal protein S18 acetylase RimI-like enzyme